MVERVVVRGSMNVDKKILAEQGREIALGQEIRRCRQCRCCCLSMVIATSLKVQNF